MIEYGITTSQAHAWVHVCPLDACFYWYPRKEMIEILGRFQEREIPTARGRIVRLFGNRRCDGGIIRDIDREHQWFSLWPWKDCRSDGEAGEIAEAAFMRLTEENGFPYPITAKRYEAKSDQFKGKDFRVIPAVAGFDVEVKADFVGGEWGTGNLFVQTHELRHQHGARHAHRTVA